MFNSRILVVEDEAIIALGIKKKLEELGHNVVGVVFSGKEAVEIALKEEPDLILMDISLEGNMDGIEAACKIRSKINIPIIYLTAGTNEELFQRLCITEHFQGVSMTEHYAYLSKPFSKKEMDVNIELTLYKYSTKKKRFEIPEKEFQKELP
ncbi:MAG: response regulator [Methanobacterium sp.]|jgi:CheY-like chemotaxis protein|nr:response regulator [Methanobacterium sp.]